MFDALVLSLPSRNSTLRMRVWRALKEAGCGVLRDGVYLLPTGAGEGQVLARMESEIGAGGGFAMRLALKPGSDAQLAQLRRLFDRGSDYGALVQKIGAARSTLARLGQRKARTLVQRLQRAFDRLAAIDFFPGEAKLQATGAMSTLARELEETYSLGEPRPARKRLRQADRKRYLGRTWATRRDLWVDRLASAWLIKRFIDREAKFVWIERPKDCPKKAVGFDFDGAEFTHLDNRVTFEVLAASFGLHGDPALGAIGAAVHFLDIGGIPVPDAKGLETLLTGIKQSSRSDDALLAEAMRILDLFYSAYARGMVKTG
jgi:hypothetical protein